MNPAARNILLLIVIATWAPATSAIDNQKDAHQANNQYSPQPAPGVISEEALFVTASDIRKYARRKDLFLRSHVALVYDEREGELLYQRNAGRVSPVASISKLMTAMVILDAELPMDEIITISSKDKDRIRYAKSRLPYGAKLSRRDLLMISLLSSENRAAAALARTYPGGSVSFVYDMNNKAANLGLKKTRFADPAGLHNDNVSTAKELMTMVLAAGRYASIREFTTMTREIIIDQRNGREMTYGNTNRLVKKDTWPIRLSKTGFTNDAGNCLVMQTSIGDRPVLIVLLNSWGKLSKYGDANRIKKWLIKTENRVKKVSRT